MENYGSTSRFTILKSGEAVEWGEGKGYIVRQQMSEQDSAPRKPRLAETPEEQKRWMAQWREAEKALLEVKREELRALTDEEAVASFNALDMPPELVYPFPTASKVSA